MGDFKLEPWSKVLKELANVLLKKILYVFHYLILLIGFLISAFLVSGVFMFFNASDGWIFFSVICTFFLYITIYGYVLHKLGEKKK